MEFYQEIKLDVDVVKPLWFSWKTEQALFAFPKLDEFIAG